MKFRGCAKIRGAKIKGVRKFKGIRYVGQIKLKNIVRVSVTNSYKKSQEDFSLTFFIFEFFENIWEGGPGIEG